MSALQRMAQGVTLGVDHSKGIKRSKHDNDTEVFIDPATAIMAGKMIYTIIKAFRACRADETVAYNMARYPGRNSRRQIKKAVRKHIGWFAWMRGEGKHYEKAIEDYGRTVSWNEVNDIFVEEQGGDVNMVYRT